MGLRQPRQTDPPCVRLVSLDKRHAVIYPGKMRKFVRILVFTLLAAFATSTVVHAAGTTTMAVKMALTDGGGMEAECKGCDMDKNGDQAGLSCDIGCIVPFVANLGHDTALSPRLAASHEAWGLFDSVGRTGPPEPYPPRFFI